MLFWVETMGDRVIIVFGPHLRARALLFEGGAHFLILGHLARIVAELAVGAQ